LWGKYFNHLEAFHIYTFEDHIKYIFFFFNSDI
jgi:hypothetical protein